MEKIAKIAIALVYQDHFGYGGVFERRELMIKRIEAASGGYGLPGIEITSEIEAKGIEIALREAIMAEMTGMIVPDLPFLCKEIVHEGKHILVYRAQFVGRPERDIHEGASAVHSDWSPYRLTDLAKKVIKFLPRERNLGNKKNRRIRATAF